MFTIVEISKLDNRKIINAVNNSYLTSNLNGKRISVVPVKNKTKQVDDLQLIETYHRILYYTIETLRIRERNFLPTDTSQTYLSDTKLDQIFVWDSRGMFENSKPIELLNCHIEKLQRGTILITPINENSYQVFLNQQNALGLYAERLGGVFCVHKIAKSVVRV